MLSIEVALKLDMDLYETKGNEEEFIEAVLTDLVSSISEQFDRVDRSKISCVSMNAGSIIMQLKMERGLVSENISLIKVVQELKMQLQSESSDLRRGTFTNKAISLKVLELTRSDQDPKHRTRFERKSSARNEDSAKVPSKKERSKQKRLTPAKLLKTVDMEPPSFSSSMEPETTIVSSVRKADSFNIHGSLVFKMGNGIAPAGRSRDEQSLETPYRPFRSKDLPFLLHNGPASSHEVTAQLGLVSIIQNPSSGEHILWDYATSEEGSTSSSGEMSSSNPLDSNAALPTASMIPQNAALRRAELEFDRSARYTSSASQAPMTPFSALPDRGNRYASAQNGDPAVLALSALSQGSATGERFLV